MPSNAQCQAMRNAKQCTMPSNAKLRVESKPQIISVKELPGRSICGDHLRTLPSVACPVETCGNHWETLEAHGSAMNRCSSVSCFSWNRSSLRASPDWGTHVSWYLQGKQPGANSDHAKNAKSHEELCWSLCWCAPHLHSTAKIRPSWAQAAKISRRTLYNITVHKYHKSDQTRLNKQVLVSRGAMKKGYRYSVRNI